MSVCGYVSDYDVHPRFRGDGTPLPLTVTYSPQYICAVNGSSVLITCTIAEGYSIHSGLWYKDGEMLVPYGNPDFEYDPYYVYEYQLRLHNLYPQHSGRYDFRIETTHHLEGRGINAGTLHVSGILCLLGLCVSWLSS